MGQLVGGGQFGQNKKKNKTKIHQSLGMLELMTQAIGHVVQIATWVGAMMVMKSLLP
jgi:hypothetical protein